MSTSANLIIQTENEYLNTTVNFDGHPKHMLSDKALLNYQDYDSAMLLIQLGDLSSIGSTLQDCESYYLNYGEDWDDACPKSLDLSTDLKSYFGSDCTYFYSSANGSCRRI